MAVHAAKKWSKTVTPERWKKLKPVFIGASALSPGERERFAKDALNGDDDSFAEVKRLLDSIDDAADFIDEPIFSDPKSYVGQKVGNYRIDHEIGRGGMGIVFLAHREGEFEQKAAVKVLKRGIDSDEIVRRFNQERQILASLHHPNIAGLLDGGTTDDGLPFFVMEYVEGLPLIRYCDENGLLIDSKLRLFRDVCSAVTYAHGRLIVHRDLKPSNVIVTSDGVPKLLDFGIAKILSEDGSLTQFTQTSNRLLTPEYASPEQVRGEEITTASDVYALGVVMYQFLTGRLPYNFVTRSAEEIFRLVCDAEPISPQQINGSRLAPDLKNIVLYSLRKERYKSVEAFADDIERYLKELPVTARPNTTSYRLTKFVKRNRIGAAATALLVVIVIVGITGTLWQSRQAQKQQEKAENINAFLEETLQYSNPVLNPLKKQGQDMTVNEAIDEAAKRLESGEFDGDPQLKVELERTIADTYFSQGKNQLALAHMTEYTRLLLEVNGENDPRFIEGSALRAALLFMNGNLTEAESSFRQYLPRLRAEFQRGNVKIEVMPVVLNNFAYLRRTQGDSHEAELLFRQTLDLMPRMPEKTRIGVATTRSTLASTLGDQGRFDEALQTAREAADEYLWRNETDSPNYGFSLTILGGFLSEKGDFGEADENLRAAETIFRRTLSPKSLWLGDNLRNQAISLYRQQKYAEAIAKADETLKIFDEGFGKLYENYPTVLIIQGLVMTKTGHETEGEKILREAVSLRTDLLPKEHFWVAMANSALGENLMTQNRFAEAEPLLVESYQSLKISQGEQNPRTLLAKTRVDRLHETPPKSDRNR